MTTEFKLPELGENVEAGDVVKILVSVGDRLELDQPVLELETDKATVEVPASVSGIVKAIHVNEGEQINVGQLVLTVETSGPDTTTVQPVSPAPEKEPVPTPPTDGKEEPAALQPDQSQVEPPAAIVSEPAASPSAVPAAPNVRRLAREIGVDITQVQGSGPMGRVSMDDVKRHARQLQTSVGAVMPAGQVSAPALPDFTKWGEVSREPMSNVRRTTARHLSQSWATVPHVTQFDKANVGELEQLRKRFAKKAEEAGGKLTVTAILLKVIASALKTFPKFNTSVDMANNEIIYKHYYHIGVAVDTDRGLLVPVIRDVDQKNLLELAVELSKVGEKARSRKLGLEDMRGGTFTITNLGGIGGTNFTPIINSPEVAILGVARSRVEPVYRDGQFEPRLMLPLALSYDHRLIDGADAARFLRWVAQALEEPFLLSLQGW